MAKPPEPWGSLANPPSEVEITVIPGARQRLVPKFVARHRAGIAAALAAALVVAAGVIALANVGGSTPRTPALAQPGTIGDPGAAGAIGQPGVGGAIGAPGVDASRTAGAPGVAEAYRYPLGCLSVTISAADPAYAAARLNRASPCWRYGAYVTAIFHRVRGVWRLALLAASNSCPAVSLPAAVRAQLAVCSQQAAGPSDENVMIAAGGR